MTAAGPVSQHAVHVGTLLGPVALFAAWAAWADVRAWQRRRNALTSRLGLAAGIVSIGAAAIHVVVSPTHLSEDVLYGAFFLGLATAQLSWGVLVVVRPHRWLLTAGALGNLAVLTLWGVTRTTGVPLGVAAGQREGIGVLDTSTAVLELVVIACCALMLRAPRVAAVAA